MNQAGGAKAKRMFLTPVGFLKKCRAILARPSTFVLICTVAGGVPGPQNADVPQVHKMD